MQITTYRTTVRELVDAISAGRISLQPDFQRQEVWSLKKKRALIDTIMRGWIVPPIHLIDGGGRVVEVLDGQQRLSALRDFLGNRISIDGHMKPEEASLFPFHGLRFLDLPSDAQTRILRHEIDVHSISHFQPEEPSELFYRLNQPTSLTSGEKRNSLYGPARNQLKELVSYFESSENRIDTIGFSNSRYSYDDVIARILFFIEEGSLAIKGTESRVSGRFQIDRPFHEDVYSKVIASIESFSLSRLNARKYRFNKASLLSWLIFFSRFEGLERLEIDYMDRFLSLEAGESDKRSLVEAFEVFSDRSSLRVTDVSSVIYRDFVLNYVYYKLYKVVPFSVDRNEIIKIDEEYRGSEDSSFEGVLEECLNISAWGQSL